MAIKVFVSYSRKDASAVRQIVSALEQGHLSLWHDTALHGGDHWWQEVLRQIRACDVFLVALTDHALASKPCRAELQYARDLGLPILPVQIGEVRSLRTSPVGDLHVLDYREPTATTGIALSVALSEAASSRRDPPDPLPPAPPVPFEYLHRLESAVEADQLSHGDQSELIGQLRDCLRKEDDASVRQDAGELLARLRRRADLTTGSAQAIDELLAELRTTDGPTRVRWWRGSRLAPLTAAAVIAVVLLGIGAFAWLSPGADQRGAASISAGNGTTGQSGSPVTSPTETLPPTPIPEEQLRAMLPADFDPAACTSGTPAGDGDVAALVCGPSLTQPGPSTSVFHLYPGRIVDSVFIQDTIELELSELTPGYGCPRHHGYDDYQENGRFLGRVACWVGTDNAAYLMWTETEFGAEAVISIPQGGQPGLQTLWDWWVEPTRSGLG